MGRGHSSVDNNTALLPSWTVTPWMVPPRTKYHSHTWSPPAADGPTLVMVFQVSVEAEKWARKDEADYVVRLSHRLGFEASSTMGLLRVWRQSLNYLSKLSRCVVDCVVHICDLK